MRKRLVLGGLLVVATAGLAVPAMASTSPTTVPPACVVVNGPNGLHVQAGYAPNGPTDCTALP